MTNPYKDDDWLIYKRDDRARDPRITVLAGHGVQITTDNPDTAWKTFKDRHLRDDR